MAGDLKERMCIGREKHCVAAIATNQTLNRPMVIRRNKYAYVPMVDTTSRNRKILCADAFYRGQEFPESLLNRSHNTFVAMCELALRPLSSHRN